MVQIDDAGSGSLVGGTGIGIFDTSTNKYHFEIIPLKYYQTSLFKDKKYQDYVVYIIEKVFNDFKITKNDDIQVCQGYMFDKLRIWLTKNNYNWQNTKIEGPLQIKVEDSFNQYVINLGLPKNFIKHARYAFSFHRLLKWVIADMDIRKKLCKTQWKSWQKWGNVEKSIYRNSLTYPDYCLKCGEKMEPPLDVVSIEYKTVKPATINLHKNCYKGKLKEKPPIFLRDFSVPLKFENKILPLDKNQALFVKVLHGKTYISLGNGSIIGFLPENIGKKISFWMQKKHRWNVFLKDIINKQAIVNIKLDEAE